MTAGANVGLPATADETGFVAGGTHYYRQGASLKLSYTGDNPNNYRADFSVSPDNTGATIYNQNELTVGQGDITVSVELSNVPLTDIATGTLENIPDQTYTGSPIRPAVTITVGDKELVEGTDYTLDYDSNTDLGTATVTATGQGKYTGTFTMPDDDVTVTATFIENELELADAADNTTTIATAEGKTYEVTLSGRTLYKDGDWNTLYYPQPDLTNVDNPKYPRIKACRSYFQLNGLTAGDPAPSHFVLNFGEENTTGIVDAEANSSLFTLHSSLSGWYTIDGRKLSGKPTKPGLYINGSKMTVLKKVK